MPRPQQQNQGNPLARPPFISVRQVGIGGLIVKGDPQDIKETESPDMRNISFDSGIIGPRPGTTLYIAQPSGETGTPLQLLKARDSRGTTYLIAVYGVNFYLLDTTTVQWIKLNAAYSPAKSGLFYGFDNWNQGTGNDSFYFCNGVDSMMKWNQALSHLSVAAAPSDSTITLKDSSGFPASGTVVLMSNAGTPFTLAYTSNDGTSVLTLSGTVGQAVNLGNSCTMVMLQMSGMKVGKVVKVSAPQSGVRLFVANNVGHETSIFFSKSTNQEDFGTTADATTGGVQVITNGSGGIIDLVDFGTYLLVIQKDAFTNFYFSINTTVNTITGIVTPLEYGESISPVGNNVGIIVENDYYYPSNSQGIYQLVPASTGQSTATQNNSIADDILALLNGLISFTMGSVAYFQRQIMWTCSSIPGVNDLILVRDLVWNAWTIWDNINAVDLQETNNILYLLCGDDGGLYFLDTTSSQDFRSGQAVGYSTRIFTKRFDSGEPANPKQQAHAMVQGYITQNTKLFVDVLYNEAGSLAVGTYVIDGSNPAYVQQIPIFTPGRVSLGQNPIGGAQIGTIGTFRVYLDLFQRVGAHVIQLKFYTSNIGDQWGVTGVAVNPEPVEKVPSEIVLGIQ